MEHTLNLSKHESHEYNKEEILKFLNTFIFEKQFSGDIENKNMLFKSLQEEWYQWALKNNIYIEKGSMELSKYLESLVNIISVKSSGFADTPKLQNLLPIEENGLSCISTSIIASSFLEKEKIPYSFLNPQGHTALQVSDVNEKFYVDARNGKVVPLTKYVEKVEEYKGRYIIFFTNEVKEKFYSYAIEYKNKSEILSFVFSNLVILDQLNNGDISNASNSLDNQQKAAKSVRNLLNQYNIKSLEYFIENHFLKGDEYLNKLSEEEKKRLDKIGFYSS